MTDKIPTIAQLSVYLPHRPPMIWIDDVHQVSDTSGSCLVHLKGGAHYMSEVGPRQSSAVEWMAQAYGYVCAARAYQKDDHSSANKAFLAQVRKAVFKHSIPKSGTLLVEVEEKRVLGPLCLISSRMKDFKTGKVLVEAELKLFAE